MRGIEANLVPAAKCERPLGLRPGETRRQRLAVAPFRHLTGQARDHGLVARVLTRIEGEATIQFGLDMRDLAKRTVRREIVDEAQRSPMRTHRMGRRRPRTDPVQLERAHMHVIIPKSPEASDRRFHGGRAPSRSSLRGPAPCPFAAVVAA